MSSDKDEQMMRSIRRATEDDLQFLRHPPDAVVLSELRKAEIAEALTATARPRHWRPVDVDPALMR